VHKPSPHTINAYRQDFAAIVALLAGNSNRIGNQTPADITADRMRSALVGRAVTAIS
jgi:site-specific recombinase XerC